MKRLLYVTALLTISTIAIAQDSGNKKHEIGLSMYSLTNVVNFTSDGDSFFNYLPQNNFANAILYKYHWQKVALRVNVNYKFKNFPDDVNPNELIEGELSYGKIWSMGAKVGIERKFGNAKWQPIIAVDAFYNYGKNTARPYYRGGPTIDLVNIPGPTISHSGGISPSLGVVYRFIPSLSIRLETNALLGWYKQEYEGASENLHAGIYFRYNPISTFSVNYHF